MEKRVNMFIFHADMTSWFCSVAGHVSNIFSNEGSHIKRCRNNNYDNNKASLITVVFPSVCVRYLHGGGCGARGRGRAVCKGNIGDGKELLFAEDGDKENPQHQPTASVILLY